MPDDLAPAQRLALLRDMIARRREDAPIRPRAPSPKRPAPRGIPHTSFHVPTGPRADTAPYTRNRRP